jgi:archaetidylinositol phosphate synthase
MGTHDVGTVMDRAYRYITVPIAQRLAAYRWLTPSMLTVLAFVLGGIGTPLLIVNGSLSLAGALFVLSDLVDYLDGDVARIQGTTSAEGDILDGVLDRYTDFLVVAALFYSTLLAVPSPSMISSNASILERSMPLVGFAALLGCMLPSYVQAVTIANGKRTVQSLGGRGTRNRVLIAGLLFCQPAWTLVTIAVLGNVATVHRLRGSLRQCR